MAQTLGERVRGLRKERGWTLRQLADNTEVEAEDGTTRTLDFTFLSKIENDKEQASEKTIGALAKALRTDKDELLLLGEKIPSEVKKSVATSPAARDFMRSARYFTESEWERVMKTVQGFKKK